MEVIMKKTRSFLLTASVCIATTFTLSCSGDDPGDNSGVSNLSDLPKQVYLEDYDDDYNLIVQGKYEGNGNIAIILSKYRSYGCGGNDGSGSHCECTSYDGVVSSCKEEDLYDTLPAGKIQAGQVQLDLPDVKKYLRNLGQPCDGVDEEHGETCQSTLSVPKNLTVFSTDHILVANADIPGKSYCRLRPRLIISGDDYAGIAGFFYLSESVKISGTVTYTYTDNDNDGTEQINYDWNFSKGWNIFYDYENKNNVDEYNRTIFNTSDLSKTGGTLEWRLRCYDNYYDN
jgi:hypothetical protein